MINNYKIPEELSPSFRIFAKSSSNVLIANSTFLSLARPSKTTEPMASSNSSFNKV